MINEDEEVEETPKEEMKVNKTRVRVCPICQKRFRSGKALGGHMRIHKDIQPRRRPIIMSKGTCIVCGKEFPSDKSLFGHMRSHPERKWRGVCPPSVDLRQTTPLMGWAVTAKRGRKAVSKSEEDRLCVYYLMMLAQNGDESHEKKGIDEICIG